MSLSFRNRSADFRTKPRLPWQLVVVMVLLGLEGLGNFFGMFGNPLAALWLGAKVLFITGFMKRWRPVYWLFLVIGLLHVLEFGLGGQIGISVVNLVLVGLTASQHDWFQPESHETATTHQVVDDGNPYRVSQP